VIEVRRAVVTATNQARRAALEALEQPQPGVITPRYLTACVRELLRGTDTLVLTEAITNYQVVAEHLRASRPGSLLGSGGSSLGWAGGGAVGANPDVSRGLMAAAYVRLAGFWSGILCPGYDGGPAVGPGGRGSTGPGFPSLFAGTCFCW